MAELSYDDVRRAAQDAVRELYGVVSGLRSNSEDLRRSVQSSSVRSQLNDLTTRLNTLQGQIGSLNNALRNQNNAMYLLQNMQQNINELHRRLSISEEFIRYMYSYLNAQAQREE